MPLSMNFRNRLMARSLRSPGPNVSTESLTCSSTRTSDSVVLCVPYTLQTV